MALWGGVGCTPPSRTHWGDSDARRQSTGPVKAACWPDVPFHCPVVSYWANSSFWTSWFQWTTCWVAEGSSLVVLGRQAGWDGSPACSTANVTPDQLCWGHPGPLWVWSAVFCICNCLQVLGVLRVHPDSTQHRHRAMWEGAVSCQGRGRSGGLVALVAAKLTSKSAFSPALTYNPFWTLPPGDGFCFIKQGGFSQKKMKRRNACQACALLGMNWKMLCGKTTSDNRIWVCSTKGMGKCGGPNKLSKT